MSWFYDFPSLGSCQVVIVRSKKDFDFKEVPNESPAGLHGISMMEKNIFEVSFQNWDPTPKKNQDSKSILICNIQVHIFSLKREHTLDFIYIKGSQRSCLPFQVSSPSSNYSEVGELLSRVDTMATAGRIEEAVEGLFGAPSREDAAIVCWGWDLKSLSVCLWICSPSLFCLVFWGHVGCIFGVRVFTNLLRMFQALYVLQE